MKDNGLPKGECCPKEKYEMNHKGYKNLDKWVDRRK